MMGDLMASLKMGLSTLKKVDRSAMHSKKKGATGGFGADNEVLKKLEEMRRKIADSDSDDESDSEDEW